MACKCNKKTVVYENKKIQIYDRSTNPDDACLTCMSKHLALALFLFNRGEKDRAFINMYLAYKHLEKRYKSLAETVFDCYKKLIAGEAGYDEIKTFAAFFYPKRKTFTQSEQQTILNLENELTAEQKVYTYLWSAFELIFNEFGYQEINRLYAIGYLQLACENEADAVKKQVIRALWIDLQNNVETVEKFDAVLTKI